MRTAAAVLLLISSVGAAQDLVAVAPKNAKVEYEDARVRVVRLKIAAYETLPMHDRPTRVVITLTPNDVVLTSADGTSRTTRTPAGEVAWSGPGKRTVKNGAAALENIVVELKSVKEPAKSLTTPPDPRPEGYLDEPFHRWVLENQYVRVYDVRVPAGATTQFHKHAFDTVFVGITDEFSSEQPQGGAWKAPEKYRAGDVSFSPDSKQMYVHRVRNEARTEFHIIVVQLK